MKAIQIRLLDPRLGRDFPLPEPATDGSAGMDLRACVEAPMTVAPGGTSRITTALIPSDYQGRVYVSCWNRSGAAFDISPGDRIAQLVFVPVVRAAWEVVEQFDDSERGGGGFGHTGHA